MQQPLDAEAATLCNAAVDIAMIDSKLEDIIAEFPS